MHLELIKLEKTFNPSILTRIDDPLFRRYQIELWMKRDDLLHPVISGNKWRKLKYILDHALTLGADTLISMGGAYSNHLHALAYVGKVLGMKTVGLIRGERPEVLTPTLQDMAEWGMELKFVSRTEYRQLRQYKGYYDLPGLKPRHYWLPEGGAQALALKGVAELVDEMEISYDTLCVPSGTGTTLAGIIEAVPEQVSVLGVAALKNAGFLTAEVEGILSQSRNNWQINLDYHFGGFAKTNAELNAFIEDFELKTTIPLEPVYTGKMMHAVYDLIKKRYFKPGQRIIAVHTGGLQGKRGFS
ncbi:1-aminocyclopropane-1-carboxylate deaminase/D-cysteine desulfhydrase [Candidatus Methylobacter oryzae]|uniref:1-aminocyclopropane-1-carboxylate deaminase/D-cysteine desulfhydrase n=1 Tax=Candidatus Methylobacter oryzae TaxID=2497749 RepID=A0ABY3CAF6_9GAMM|nr:pyridoxal-phosphate dependent enzyme [Candidatus Methylobacter oryzae]TRW94567.1 1-aminocyclopropane-1-carboxylate deaminase/D-cysteine desulfhydrase [Candidatus Methylobacter oryzae]